MATLVTRYVNPDSAGGDGTTQALSGANAAYASLNAWNAARARNLVSADEIELVICESNGAADTSQCILGAWTTDATRYIRIEAGASHRASTQWSNSKYRLTRNTIAMTQILDISSASYVRVKGLQIQADCSNLEAANRNAILITCSPAVGTGGGDIRISDCHLRHIGTLPFNPHTGMAISIYGAPSTVGASPAPNFYFWNNICSWEATGTWTEATYHCGIRVEHRTHNLYLYNNTIRGAWTDGTGGDNNSDRLHYLKNNLFSGPTNPTNGSHVNTRCDYNATGAAGMGYTEGSNDRVSQTFTFASSTDYAITSGDAGAKNFGLSDPGSGLFSDDIDGKTRSGSWDIGAFEVAAGISEDMITTLWPDAA